MHPNPKRIIPVIIVLALLGLGYWYFFGGGTATADTGAFTASGTIEADEIKVNPELGGRVTAVNASEGDTVQAGALVIQFDTSLLEAQKAQAAAALQAAQAGHNASLAAAKAAQANLDLLKAGPSAEQLAIAQTVIDRNQIAVNAAQDTYDALSDSAKDTTQGKTLKTALDTAKANLDNAKAQYTATKAGARTEQLAAAQAQLEAAQAQADATQAQADAAQAALNVLDVQIKKLSLVAPSTGVVLARAIEPGEVASPGSALLTLADLSHLHITVYVPEDKYGQLQLGQSATVAVDSFTGEKFNAKVVHISDKAEFTPRNVQTSEGRKTTVFAIKLEVDNPDGKLKPGMPADVDFGK